jgi:hypothetical protein
MLSKFSAAQILLAASAVTGAAFPAAAQDKASYSLFNPVPVAQMREMSTDRPDLTESPFTVDAGHYQVEMDFWNRTIDRSRDSGLDLRTIDTAYAPVNVKVGLTNSMDLQIVLEPYLETLTRNVATGAVLDKNHGVGDVTARLKINFWGNEGGGTALAIMPFIKLPTNSRGMGNNHVEGGVILPYSFSVFGGIDVGVMTEVDMERNSSDTGYNAVFVNTATAGIDLTDRIGMYTEIATSKSSEQGARWAVSFDTGVTFAITPNVQLDAGINVGLTSAAPDLNPFVGLSFRF